MNKVYVLESYCHNGSHRDRTSATTFEKLKDAQAEVKTMPNAGGAWVKKVNDTWEYSQWFPDSRLPGLQYSFTIIEQEVH